VATDPCIEIVKKAAGVSDDEALELIEEVRRRKQLLEAEGKGHRAEEDLKRFAERKAQQTRINAALARKHAALNILKRQRVLDPHWDTWMERADPAEMSKGAFGQHVREGYQALLYGSVKGLAGARASVAARRGAIMADWLGALTREISQYKPELIKALRDDRRLMDNTIREMYELRPEGRPGITGDPDAKFMAELLTKYSEMARVRANNAGAFIRRLPGWTPQNHDAKKLIKAGRETWVRTVLEHLDAERSFSEADPEEIPEILGEIYQNIVTGRDRALRPAERGEFTGPRNLARSLEKHRVLHFRSADDFLIYHERFGRGNVFTGTLEHLERLARKVSLMEVLGPNPENMLAAHLKASARKIREDPNLPEEYKQAALQHLNINLGRREGTIGRAFAEVMGETLIAENPTLARWMAGTRAVQSLAKLGGVTLSSINDTLTYAMNLRHRGRGLFESYLDALGVVFRGRTPKEKKEISYVLGAMYEGILGDIANRWNAQDRIPGKMAEAMDTFFRWNGLTWWTNRLRAGAVHGASAELALNARRAWSGLNENYRAVLETHGIGAREWRLIRKMPKEIGDYDYVLPEFIDTISDADIDRLLIPERIAEIRKALKVDEVKTAATRAAREQAFEQRLARVRQEARQDFRTKIQSFFVDEMDSSVIDADDRTRALLLQGTRPGTLVGEAARFVAQFKSFPIAYTQRILRGQRYRRAAGGPDPVGIANIIAGSLIFGYAAMTAKDLVKGRTPRDPRHWNTWLAAALQSGGAGIYGDFFLGKASRFGNDALETMAGPVPETAGSIVGMVQKVINGDADAGDAFRFVQNNTPVINLWYTRYALDTLILYNLQEMLGPGTLRRRERRMKEDYGQEYIVPPSSYVPRGGTWNLTEPGRKFVEEVMQ